MARQKEKTILKAKLSYRSGFVAMIGRPNVGKSTLMNKILGEKIAIVSDKPQTTRNRILGVHTAPDTQVIFLDTPGVHAGRDTLNRRMVQTALATLDEVDLVLLLVDPLKTFGPPEQRIADRLKETKTPKILVVNKIDLVDRNALIPILNRYHVKSLFSEVIPLSALTGENIDPLLSLVRSFLPEGPPLFPEDVLTDQPMRTLAGEMIREKVINLTEDEIPYSIAVEVESFKEDSKKQLTTIHATLYVERPSQKGIVIGRGGTMLKAIREGAQADIMRFLAMKVNLILWVKVKKNWSGDPRFLNQMGY